MLCERALVSAKRLVRGFLRGIVYLRGLVGGLVGGLESWNQEERFAVIGFEALSRCSHWVRVRGLV